MDVCELDGTPSPSSLSWATDDDEDCEGWDMRRERRKIFLCVLCESESGRKGDVAPSNAPPGNTNFSVEYRHQKAMSDKNSKCYQILRHNSSPSRCFSWKTVTCSKRKRRSSEGGPLEGLPGEAGPPEGSPQVWGYLVPHSKLVALSGNQLFRSLRKQERREKKSDFKWRLHYIYNEESSCRFSSESSTFMISSRA